MGAVRSVVMVGAFHGSGVAGAAVYYAYITGATAVAPGGSRPTGAAAGTKGADVNNPMDVLGARNAADVDHPTGPAIGERLPDITLPDQSGGRSTSRRPATAVARWWCFIARLRW